MAITAAIALSSSTVNTYQKTTATLHRDEHGRNGVSGHRHSAVGGAHGSDRDFSSRAARPAVHRTGATLSVAGSSRDNELHLGRGSDGSAVANYTTNPFPSAGVGGNAITPLPPEADGAAAALRPRSDRLHLGWRRNQRNRGPRSPSTRPRNPNGRLHGSNVDALHWKRFHRGRAAIHRLRSSSPSRAERTPTSSPSSRSRSMPLVRWRRTSTRQRGEQPDDRQLHRSGGGHYRQTRALPSTSRSSWTGRLLRRSRRSARATSRSE
jgi:hypothetical protein